MEEGRRSWTNTYIGTFNLLSKSSYGYISFMNIKFEVENHLECLEYAPKIWNFFIMVPSSEVVCSSKSQWSEGSGGLLSMTILLFVLFWGEVRSPFFCFFCFSSLAFVEGGQRYSSSLDCQGKGRESPLCGTFSFHFIFMM